MAKTTMKPCSPSRVKRYRGLRAPRCRGIGGCTACMRKYQAVQRNGLRVVAP